MTNSTYSTQIEENYSHIYDRVPAGLLEKLRTKKVAIAGLGGLGSNIAIMLARSGVNQLHLIDFDVIEQSNLNRQQYALRHIGMPKAKALEEVLNAINPDLKLRIDQCRVSADNIKELFSEDDIICEAMDSPECKSELVSGILYNFPEKYIVAGSGMSGYGNSNAITTKKISDHFYLCGDGVTDMVEGTIAPRVILCAAHQANAVIEIIERISK